MTISKALEDKAVKSVRSELATKDFVEAKFNEVRTEVAETKLELETKLNETKLELKEEISHLKLYVIAAIILIVVLQPRVFDFLTSIFK